MNFEDNPAESDEADGRFARLNDFAWVFFFTKNPDLLTLDDMSQKLMTPICRKYVTGSQTESTDPKAVSAAKSAFLA